MVNDKIAVVRIGVVLVDTGMSDDAVLVQAYLGVNGYPPLRVFEPEPRFLYGDGNAGDGFSIKAFIFFSERRGVGKSFRALRHGFWCWFP